MFYERFARKLELFGEQFTVNGRTYRGVFRILDGGTMNSYLDDVQIIGLVHPGLLLVTEGAAVINVDDRITRDGTDYLVKKTSVHRIGDTVVVKVAVLTN